VSLQPAPTGLADVYLGKLERLVGGRTAKALDAELGIRTAEELLRHLPRRYEKRGSMTDLSHLELGDHVTVMARVDRAANRDYLDKRAGGRRGRSVRTEVVVTDGRHELLLTFFRRPWITRELTPGASGLFSGKVQEFRGRLQLLHPDYALHSGGLDQDLDGKGLLADTIVPIYPATAKLSSWTIGRAVPPVLDAAWHCATALPDPLPAEVVADRGLPSLLHALEQVHRPKTQADWMSGRERFRFEEAFVVQVALAKRRQLTRAQSATPRARRVGGLLDRFDDRLPFELTAGQRAVAEQLSGDLAQPHPMHRLLQGEVGSGKTVVALRAMLQVVEAGGQAALLAPTEVLAQQHHRSIRAALGDLAEAGMLGGAVDGTRVRLLTGSLGAAQRRDAMLDAASGAAGILIGTHALLEERVAFADLGLVVVDEQHRFGVEQRAALSQKSGALRPHVLVMTATPIPRTIAMTVFGDLETSTLSELPAGRQRIQTTVVPSTERPEWVQRSWRRVREEVARGHQAYVVCARIGDDSPDDHDGADGSAAETDGAWAGRLDAADDVGATSDGSGVAGTRRAPRPASAAVDVYAELAAGPLAGLRVELLHGRLAPDDKDDVMRRFAAGTVDVLVATTVIEVGVDVPNATVMAVMDADRFGVSQLHQLRGRVGRGADEGLCLLLTDLPRGHPGRRRLDAVAATSDGFALSRLDVSVRREGDVLGTRQSGRRSSLRLLSVVDDEELILEARDTAAGVVAADPSLNSTRPLQALVDQLLLSSQGEYLDKG
jgi:ATP-dependent DNA helicase RecG